MSYYLHDKKEPAMAAAGQLAIGVTAVAGLFQDAMERLLEFPKHDGRYSQAEVQGIVDTAEHLKDALKEALDMLVMAANREERLLTENAVYEHRIETLKQLLAIEEAKVADLEAELDETAGGNSSVRISIPKVG